MLLALATHMLIPLWLGYFPYSGSRIVPELQGDEKRLNSIIAALCHCRTSEGTKCCYVSVHERCRAFYILSLMSFGQTVSWKHRLIDRAMDRQIDVLHSAPKGKFTCFHRQHPYKQSTITYDEHFFTVSTEQWRIRVL